MNGYLARLTSRKWLLTLGVAILLAGNRAWSELVQITVGFLAVEGGVDALARVSEARLAAKAVPAHDCADCEGTD